MVEVSLKGEQYEIIKDRNLRQHGLGCRDYENPEFYLEKQGICFKFEDQKELACIGISTSNSFHARGFGINGIFFSERNWVPKMNHEVSMEIEKGYKNMSILGNIRRMRV